MWVNKLCIHRDISATYFTNPLSNHAFGGRGERINLSHDLLLQHNTS